MHHHILFWAAKSRVSKGDLDLIALRLHNYTLNSLPRLRHNAPASRLSLLRNLSSPHSTHKAESNIGGIGPADLNRMRLFLLPISTRRTLIYCQRSAVASKEQKGWLDKGTTKAAAIWAGWEKRESGWQKQVVDYGNKALKRIPYEEGGLKSIPPLSSRRKEDELSLKEKIEVEFPPTLIPESTVLAVLKRLGSERQSLHQSRFLWSFAGMVATIPVGILPM